MPLLDEVKKRFSLARLREFTNPDNTVPVVITDARLQTACDDAVGEFNRKVGIPFDLANASHLDAVANLGVYVKLLIGMDPAGAFQIPLFDQWAEALSQCRAQVGAGRRLTPQTDATWQPTSPTDPDDPRPRFDPDRLRGILPK